MTKENELFNDLLKYGFDEDDANHWTISLKEWKFARERMNKYIQ